MEENTSSKLRKVFSRNRTEEIGKDVWNHFVLPPFYEELDLLCASKPRVIIGGRGCGKTMILRSFSHNTVFSQDRTHINNEALNHVGLYWRTDTQFCNMMNKRGVEPDDWASAFSHLIALSLGKEILESVKSISRSNLDVISENEISGVSFKKLQAISENLPESFISLDDYLTSSLWQLESWINNVRRMPQPFFLSTKFPIHLIEVLKEELSVLSNSVFYVYIDEFENLVDYQQRLINDLLKHSQTPLIYNYAMKRHANENRFTTGSEQISDVHDFRSVDLELLLLRNGGKDFKAFASEILLSELNSHKITNFPIDSEMLRDRDKIEFRASSSYQSEITKIVDGIFVSYTQKELAESVFKDDRLSQKLSDQIASKTGNPNGEFFLPEYPEASVVIPALLSREKISLDMIRTEIGKLKQGEANKFTESWIHNNFVGSYLWLHHVALKKTCILYAGFDTFCKLSHGNIRHLLELCYKSLLFSKNQTLDDNTKISAEDQSYGVLQASEALKEEIKSFGTHSLKLSYFVNRLGYLFALDHKRDSQSENERNHFAITSESKALSNEVQKLLIEAEKWSVLFREKSTKKKSHGSPDHDEYVLNPIYAPYFLISYRKKRRVEFKAEDIEILFNGTLDDYKRNLISKFTTKLSPTAKESVLPLFASMDV